jgi:hypothetical protein
VKDNIDPIRSGRLRVYISDMGGTDPSDSNCWVTVNYMSYFYGLTEGTGDKTGYGTYLQNPVSYGMWTSPPDIGTTVICIFINGDPNYGYWIGCVPKPEALFMVPANGSTETVVTNPSEANSYGGAKKLPVTNINTNNNAINDSPTFFNEPKPVNSYLAGVLNQQGLIRDTIRGTIGSSAQRESPSRVGWGVNTPGRPIYEGGFTDETIAPAATGNGQQSSLKIISRRVGHSIVMDDGDLLGRDQLVRIRSSLGHQILMSDDGQCLHIIHANGQSWIELGKEGTIDMYATNSVNIRTQGDLNLHADNNINMHAKKDFNLYAENISVNSDKKTDFRVGTDYKIQSLGQYTLKVGSGMSLASGGEASFASGAAAFINGSKVNLNTGSAGLVPGEVKPITVVAHTDTLYDSTKGWAAAPGALFSIASRAPAHAPWSSANQGVDVKVDNNASANFPSAPSSAVAAVNAQVGNTPNTPVSASVAATVPVTGAVSKTVNKNATTNMVSQVAAMAQTGPAAAATALGAGVVQTVTGKFASVGKLAQSPQQMEAAGILKPGSAVLINSLVSQGKTVEEAMTDNLFTGMPGAENLQAYIASTTSQVKTQVSTFQQAQTQLTQSGVMTGNESSGSVAGIITATATAGLANTVNFIKTASGTAGTGISTVGSVVGKTVNGLIGSVTGSITSGNYAANLAESSTGGLNSIATSLSGLVKGATAGLSGIFDSAKGIAGSAFAAITRGFPTLTPGVPQNLKQIADKATEDVQSSGTEASDVAGVLKSAASNSGIDTASIASGAASSAINGLDSVNTAVTTGIATSLNAKSVLQNTINTVGALLPSSSSTGLSGLPGAQNAVATIINGATGATNSIPGASSISGAITQVTASVTTGNLAGGASNLINQLKVPGASLQALASIGLSPALASKLNSSIASLSSGGAVPITLPVVGINTNATRASLSTQLASVFGSSKIPLPNYGGNPATTGDTASSDILSNKLNEQYELNKKTLVKVDETRNARIAYVTAQNELPAGDPQIEVLRSRWYALVDELKSLTTVA